ncbi:nickel ABC transporter substrate-binding protein [Bacillus solitudinis]|uniref:nickel ABC transporter substrate-binding protein n=1 Tax=Bacillus solitudinis TaxID=2014074 RepID=UPI000C2330BC|nr:nickel ABC transporter substrate-binding protein [Bacillus solitudinis]
MFKQSYFVIFILAILFIIGCSSKNDVPTIQDQGSQEGKQENEGEKSITVLFSFAPSSLDPHAESISVRAGITETLVRIDENLEIQPWLAEKWEQVDETTWTFTLREGITFQDGSVLDGEAAKASFERAIEVSPAIQSLLKIKSIEASGQEITFHTEEEYPAFLTELVHTSASLVQVNAENIEESPIGTGPFKVNSYTQDVEIQLERYDGYWDGSAKIDKAVFKFNSDGNVRALSLQSNDADIAYHLSPEGLETIANTENLSVESIPSLRSHFLLYNQTKPAMQDVKIRQALDVLINRQVIAEEIMSGHATPANGPFNPSFPFGSDKKITSFNPEQAKALLEEAGYELNSAGKLEKDGEALSLNLITYTGRPELPLMAQYIQAEAMNIGIEINIVTAENIDSFLSEQLDEWDIATYSNLTAPRGDGGYFFNVAYSPEGSLNPGQINIQELNELIGQLNRTRDSGERIQLQKNAVEIIQEQLPQSFIVYPHVIVGLNERVTNWKPGAEEYYILTNTLDVK